MIDKSFISVADHQYNDPLSYESSESSGFYSDEPDSDHRIKSLSKPVHVELNGSKNKHIPDYNSDSKNSDDQFLECESDYELNSSNNPFIDYEKLIDIYTQTIKLPKRNINGKKHSKNKKSDKNKKHNNKPLHSKYDLINNMLTNNSLDSKHDMNNLERNSSFSDQIYDVAVSENSDVNSELESRIIDYHEAKKSLTEYEDDNPNDDSSNSDFVKPEDEIDELFDRVINGGYDPEFTFMPEQLDPYVKMSKSIISKKYKSNNMDSHATTNKNLTRSSSSLSRIQTNENSNEQPSSYEQEASVTNGVEGTKVDPSMVETIPTNENLGDRLSKPEDRIKSSESPKQERNKKDVERIDKIHSEQSKLLQSVLPQLRKKATQENDNESLKTESDIEKEKEKVRKLFEATKPDDSISSNRSEEEISKGLKILKLREDKRSKKSKHHKSESDSDEEKTKKDKKDKKSDEKGSKSSKSDKSDDKLEKSKEKKSEKSKKMSWNSNDYDIIFSSLGDPFSSGIIELDTKPIVLSKRGFYTIFFRNSKYPYDSSIDFYLFRIGFKYMLVNESSNQNFNIDDVVDYGNFRIKLSGNINLSPNVTKMAFIYSNSERQVLEFVLTPSAFDSKPKIVYKLFYCGSLQSIPLPLKFKRRLRVLSLDNCENLGTSVIGALYLLEKKLSEMKKRKINLSEYFDYVCGTGSGALIALCMLKGYSMKDLRSQWNLIVSSLFRWTYSLPSGIIFDYYYIEEFKKNFINILGTDFLCSKTWPQCMVTCTNVRSNPYELFLFRNYGDSKFGSLYGTSYAPMWLVGWAACALPTYVRGPSNSHLNSLGYNMINKTQLVDGSLVSSSPSLISLQELTSLYNINLRSLVKDNMDLFLSIGTSKSESDNASINSSTWQILMNCKNLMYNTQLQHLHVKNLFDEYENKYQRIQLPIYPGCKHGKTSKEAVDAVLTSTIQFISRHDNHRIEQIVNLLNQ